MGWLIILLVFLFCNAPSFASISSYELANLQKGKVLHKIINGKSLTSQKNIMGTEGKVLINAPVEEVWSLLDDKEKWSKIVKQVKEAEILSDNGNQQTVKTSIKVCKLLPKFDYTFAFDKTHKYKYMSFQKTSGCFKEIYGYFQMMPYNGATILECKVFSDPGFYIPDILCKKASSKVKVAMQAIKEEAEK